MIHVGNRYPARLFRGDRRIHLLCKGDRPIWVSPEAQKAMLETWLHANVTTTAVMVDDATGYWFEMEVVLPPSFVGNPSDGWTGDLLPGYPPVTLGLFRSETLTTWSAAGVGWDTSPGRETPETLANGWKKWFVRCIEMPAWWREIMIDVVASSDRHGKSIVAIQLFRAPVTLPHYPYAMPSQAATLQADLRAAGYTGATVSSISGPLIAPAVWHRQAGRGTLYVTMSGSNVTDVKWQGTTVGAGYPFSMPSQKAALQTMLTAALGGDPNNQAVVMLHSDTWTITLPDRVTTAQIRDFILTVAPDDPYPAWDAFGQYLGLLSANGVTGTHGNVRTPERLPLAEAARAFARLGFIL